MCSIDHSPGRPFRELKLARKCKQSIFFSARSGTRPFSWGYGTQTKAKWAAVVAGVVPVRVPLDPPVRCHQSINMVSAAHVTTTLWAARAEWAGEVRISDVQAGRRERHRVCMYMYSMWGENALPYLWSGSEATGTGAVGSCVGAGATWHVNKQCRSCGGETYSGRDYSEMEIHHPEKAVHYFSDDIATLH